MKSRSLALACLWVLPYSAWADIQLGNTTVYFASRDEGRRILMAKDEYIQRMGPFDRSARMRVGRPVSENEFLAFIGRNVADWTDAEMQRVQGVFEAVVPLLSKMPLSLPSAIQLIKTTGAEEGKAFYTRGTAIALPGSELARSEWDMKKLICHELFHVLSRQNPKLREKLYESIGFIKCDEIELPPSLKRRKITNPDAPRNDHFIRLQIDGQERLAVPILLSRTETYDIKQGGEFFAYLELKFLVVEKSGRPGKLKIVSEKAAPKLVGLEDVSGFLEQVGRNTEYIIHPEEILAENFALLVLNDPKVASPEILRKMRDVLLQKTPP